MKSTITKLFLVAFAFTLVFTSCFKDDLLKEIDALKETVSSMQRRNDSLSFFINAKADSLGKALTAAQKRSDSLASILKTKSDSLSIALGITNTNLATLTKSVDSIKVQVANVNGQLALLNSQLTSVTTQLTQLNQQFGALGADYAALNVRYQELSATLQGLNTQIAALQAEQLKLLERLNAIMLQLNPPVDITTGLVAYYPFSGNAGDSSGNGNHGIVNGAILTLDRKGRSNNAYSFSANSDMISATASTFPQNFSISLWCIVKTPWVYTTFNIFKFGPNNPSQLGGFSLRYDQNDQFYGNGRYIFAGSFSDKTTFFGNPSSFVDFQFISQWHHIVFTKNEFINNLYVDGILINSVDNPNFLIDFSNAIIQIGNQQNLNNNQCGTRVIDDVRIYNRALIQSEITYLATH